VDLCSRDRTEGGQLGGSLVLVEHVEWPVADGPAPQVRVGGSDAEVGTNHDRLETGSLLLWPGECPDRAEACRA
jgi:hypothetical protein